MQELIRTLQGETQTTTLIVTHDQQEAVVPASHLALLDQGQIRQQETLEVFFQRPKSVTVARFWGHEFLPGQAQGGRVGSPFTYNL